MTDTRDQADRLMDEMEAADREYERWVAVCAREGHEIIAGEVCERCGEEVR